MGFQMKCVLTIKANVGSLKRGLYRGHLQLLKFLMLFSQMIWTKTKHFIRHTINFHRNVYARLENVSLFCAFFWHDCALYMLRKIIWYWVILKNWLFCLQILKSISYYVSQSITYYAPIHIVLQMSSITLFATQNYMSKIINAYDNSLAEMFALACFSSPHVVSRTSLLDGWTKCVFTRSIQVWLFRKNGTTSEQGKAKWFSYVAKESYSFLCLIYLFMQFWLEKQESSIFNGNSFSKKNTRCSF